MIVWDLDLHQRLLPLKSCVFKACSWRGVLDTTVCDKVCQWLAACRWFSPCTSSTKKTYRCDIIGILLKMALRTITLTLTITLIDYACVVSKCYKSICQHFVSGFLWTLELYIGKWGQSAHTLFSFNILILIRMVGSGLHHTRNQISFCSLGLTSNTQSVLLYNYHI